MAKSNSGNGSVNKSAAIRQALIQNPKAKSKEIVSYLAGKGIKVAPTLVYYIRNKAKHAQQVQKRERIAESSRSTGTADPVKLIIRVKELSRDAGGIQSLKKLVDVLAE